MVQENKSELHLAILHDISFKHLSVLVTGCVLRGAADECKFRSVYNYSIRAQLTNNGS